MCNRFVVVWKVGTCVAGNEDVTLTESSSNGEERLTEWRDVNATGTACKVFA